ncbi:MAG TPA: hypothetical protein VF746_20575 [Longimicrobium sp.]|jgi:hypothetical protein
MTDFPPATGSPGRRLPAPTFFDPSFERLPAAASAEAGYGGPVALVYDPRADREWVADAAIAIATGWAAGGRRTVLADLSLENPILHERIGMGNMDGVVDIFLYGASLARSARSVPGRGFYLITAGTYTPEPEAIFRHPRWEKLVAGFREAQASLMLFVPADAPGLDALAQWAHDAVLLGGPPDGATFAPAAGRFAPHAWLVPPRRDAPAAAATPSASGPAPAAPPPERFPEPEPVPPWAARPPADATAAELLGVPAAAAPAPAHAAPPAEPLPVPDVAWEQAAPARGRRRGIPKKRRIPPVVLVLLVLAFMALAAGAVLWFFFPDALTRLRRPAARPAAARAAPAAPARYRADAAPAGTARPYSVFVRAFPDYQPARELAEQVADKLPGEPVYIIPEQSGGVLYHKVYAGMMEDTVAAARVRQQLLQDGTINPEDAGGTSALVQPRPLAFMLGLFPTREEAELHVAELAANAISAYPAAVPLSDGSERWTLYAGAFADSASAAPMKTQLETAGLPARLVERTGRPAASPK